MLSETVQRASARSLNKVVWTSVTKKPDSHLHYAQKMPNFDDVATTLSLYKVKSTS